MRRLLASLFLSLALVTTPIAFNGCALQQTTLPSIPAQNADQIILTAEKTAETALLTFDTFVTLERENEAMLKTANPQIHTYANYIRLHGKGWIVQLRNATKVFKANRTPDSRANLNTILATLISAIGDTQKYIGQSKAAIGH
jgi:hypothetical protein